MPAPLRRKTLHDSGRHRWTSCRQLDGYPEAWPTAKLPTSTQLPAGRHLFVAGDSHAGAYTTMLQMLSDRDGVAFNNYSQGGCAIAGLRQPSEPRCLPWYKGWIGFEPLGKAGEAPAVVQEWMVEMVRM